MPIRIFIIDDHRAAREMLARRLASLADMEVVGSTGDAGEGLLLIKELVPDVALVDTKMRSASGIDVLRQVCSASKVTRVAVLTSYIDPEDRLMAQQAGVQGYFLKQADTLKLAEGIRRLARPKGNNPKSKHSQYAEGDKQ